MKIHKKIIFYLGKIERKPKENLKKFLFSQFSFFSLFSVGPLKKPDPWIIPTHFPSSHFGTDGARFLELISVHADFPFQMQRTSSALNFSRIATDAGCRFGFLYSILGSSDSENRSDSNIYDLGLKLYLIFLKPRIRF